MTLIHDALEASTPQTHALVIGVGEYDHLPGGRSYVSAPASHTFGMRQLTSPPISASAFATWLMKTYSNPDVPLGSVELVLSTRSFVDLSGVSRLVGGTTFEEIRDAFDAWYARWKDHESDIALFYFAGHGIQAHNLLLIPEDFGADENRILDRAIDFSTTWAGMARGKARAQVCFLDCCRETPVDIRDIGGNPRELISSAGGPYYDRDAPIFCAAPGGMPAYSAADDVSFFTGALVRCLDGLAAERQTPMGWVISSDSLGTALKRATRRIRLANGASAVCAASGDSTHVTDLHVTHGPPEVMTSIRCSPQMAMPSAHLSVSNGSLKQHRTPEPEPWDLDLPLGTYDVGATFTTSAYSSTIQQQVVVPPFVDCVLMIL